MPNIANVSRAPVHFREKGGKVVEIAPGTSENVDVDPKSPRVVAAEKARLIKVGGTAAQAAKAARENGAAPEVAS